MVETVIRELPEVVKNQIAAGEVVERPASVVKELVENALDAGATQVRVDLEDGGVKLIRVQDDGCGIGPADLLLCFVPHATSKLTCLDDLEHIGSLGFRGEALASIGSVARCSITSRRPGEEGGHAIENEGGRVGEVRAAGCPEGTTIEVRDLFFNTPARRRFLKRRETELGRCQDLLQRLALAHVGVGFTLTHDKRKVFDVEPGMDLRGRVRRIFGAELAESLEPIEVGHDTLTLRGLVAPPRFSRRDAQRQMWFLNGRALRDKLLTRILKDGYRGFLEDGRQPSAFLHLHLDPALVDVNVHPMKSEVRFRDERPLFGFLVNALREAVSRTDIATPGEQLLQRLERRGDWRPNTEHGGQGFLPAGGQGGSATERLDVREPTRPGRAPAPLASGMPQPIEELEVRERPAGALEAGAGGPTSPGAAEQAAWAARDDLRGPFLQVDKTYLVRALPDGFEVIDQHALHERMTFEELRNELHSGSIAVQRRLIPEVVELARDEVQRLEPALEDIARLGIELSIFGPTSVAVQGLPSRLKHPDAEGIVRDLVAAIATHGRLPDAEDVLEEVLHRTACRSSIMAGDELTQEEVRSLLVRAASYENDQTCPHSRPTRVRFTLADLEKAFHRS